MVEQYINMKLVEVRENSWGLLAVISVSVIFTKNIDDAIDYIKNLKELQKIQKIWSNNTKNCSVSFKNDIIIATNNREFSFYKKLIIYLGYSSER